MPAGTNPALARAVGVMLKTVKPESVNLSTKSGQPQPSLTRALEASRPKHSPIPGAGAVQARCAGGTA